MKQSRRRALPLLVLLALALCSPARALDAQAPRRPNLLCLRYLTQCRWWNAKWTVRTPVLVSELQGVEREAAAVTFSIPAPAGERVEALRLVTPWREEVPAEFRVAAGKAVVSACFKLRPREDRVLFVYSGAPDAKAPTYQTDLRLTDTGREFTLANDKLVARISKRTGCITWFARRGALGGNQLAQYSFRMGGCFANRLRGGAFKSARIKDNGPCRVSVICDWLSKRGRKPLRVIYTLTAGSRRLNWSLSGEARDAARDTGWCPGKGIYNGIHHTKINYDLLHYGDRGRVRRIRMARWPAATQFKLPSPRFQEGWYAIENTQSGETVGEIWPQAHVTTVSGAMRQSVWGYHVMLSQLIPAAGTGGAFVSAGRGWRVVREQARAWNSPPAVNVGLPQRISQVPPPRVPRIGRDFIYAHNNSLRRYYSTVPGLSAREVVDRWLRKTEFLADNLIVSWDINDVAFRGKARNAAADLARLPEMLISEAHRQGFAVATRVGYGDVDPGKSGRKKKYECKVKYLGAHTEAARKIGRYDVDIFVLGDEESGYLKTAEARAAFKKWSGLDAPDKLDVMRLADSAQHKACFFKTRAINQWLRARADAIRENNKRAVLIHTINPVRRNLPDRYHDLPDQAGFLKDAVLADLYGVGYKNRIKPNFKHIRGGYGNETPVIVWSGINWGNPEAARYNQYYLVSCGAVALMDFYTPSAHGPDLDLAVADTYRHIQRTGLGRAAVACAPLKFLGVFRDNAAYLHDVTTGAANALGTFYGQAVEKISILNNVQSDILFSEHFTARVAAKYPVIMVPSDPVLSAAHAAVMRRYVESGGRLIVEAESIANPEIARLCGVERAGRKSEPMGKVRGLAAAFSYGGWAVPVRVRSGEVLARCSDRSPALIERAAGKGKVFYSPLDLSGNAGSPDIDRFIRLLIRRAAGHMPLEVNPQVRDSVDTSVQTNGRDFLIGVVNESAEKPVSVTVTASGLKPLPGAVCVDMMTGRRTKRPETISVALRPLEVRLFWLGSPEAFAAPQTAEAARSDLAAAYSLAPAALSPLAPTAPDAVGAGRKKEDRIKLKNTIYVAVLSDKGNEDVFLKARVRGDEGILEALKSFPGLRCESIDNLQPDTLAFYDAVIIPGMGWKRLPPVAQPGWEKAVRAYVRGGGGVMLCHHSNGIPQVVSQPPFPEIGLIGSYAPSCEMKVTADHPVASGAALRAALAERLEREPAFKTESIATKLDVGGAIKCSYLDYFTVNPKSGVVVVRARNGNPVVIAGRFGKGRVVMNGMGTGARSATQESPPEGGERKLLLNAVFWLAEKQRRGASSKPR